MDKEQIANVIQERTAGLLSLLGIEATVVVDPLNLEDREYMQVKIEAEEGGAELIGHRGTRLKSLSTVLSMMVPQTDEHYTLIVDVNGYRKQREEYLREITQKAIDEALDTIQPVALEPMDPWERRIVHMAVVDRTDIMTMSEGEGEKRHVVVKPVSVV